MQNKLNHELGIEPKTYLQHLDDYYNQYLPQRVKLSEKWGIQKKYIIFGFIVLCMFFIIMFTT
jgi:hypothetical protein